MLAARTQFNLPPSLHAETVHVGYCLGNAKRHTAHDSKLHEIMYALAVGLLYGLRSSQLLLLVQQRLKGEV